MVIAQGAANEEREERNPEASLVMDLSSRDDEEHLEDVNQRRHNAEDVIHRHLNGPREGANYVNHAAEIAANNPPPPPPPTNDAAPAEDDMDDAGIYGDMAEGDMVAAMLEEAQIPRSQFLGLNAEEKQKLLEARRTCKFCGKVCIKRSDLQRHLLVHTGERPWLCKVREKMVESYRDLQFLRIFSLDFCFCF